MDPPTLLKILTKRLNISELKILCFQLGIDYETLEANNKPDKVLALIEYLQRRDQLPRLVDYLRQARIDIKLGTSQARAPGRQGPC